MVQSLSLTGENMMFQKLRGKKIKGKYWKELKHSKNWIPKIKADALVVRSGVFKRMRQTAWVQILLSVGLHTSYSVSPYLCFLISELGMLFSFLHRTTLKVQWDDPWNVLRAGPGQKYVLNI